MNELNLEIEREEIPPADCVSLELLQKRLRLMEAARKEVVGVGLYDPNGLNVNFVDWVQRDLVPSPPLEVLECADEAALRAALATRTAVQYAVMKINGNSKNVLVARPGRSLVWRGKMSTFGGPNDTGMTPGETLAIINDGDITADPKIAALFKDGMGPALGRRLLNTTTSYIACRWDYKTTPRKHLLGIEVEVRNPVTGKSIKARPADWGPAEWTNRVADLSDFAAGQLGLETNDICEVIVPLPAGVAGPLPPQGASGAVRTALVAIAREQYQRYHGMHEANEPLRSRIIGYYNELQAHAGGGFVFESTTKVPWSAVFVSWCVMKAGVTHDVFHFSKQHSVYIHRAIARAQAVPQEIYPALDARTYAPEPGDIIHWNREGGGLSYADAAGKSDYPSHCVIVVDVGQDSEGPCAITVGGNQSQSVGRTRLPLSANGRLVARSEDPYISIIKMG
jgi:hypothetical protein